MSGDSAPRQKAAQKVKLHPDLPDSFEDLTIKQQRFTLEYAKSGNATNAARKAGYSGHSLTGETDGASLTAESRGSSNVLGMTGYENLRKPKIQRALADYLAENSVTDEFCANKLYALLNAKTCSTKYDPFNGWQYSAERDDHSTQLSALDMAFKLKGAYPKDATDGSNYTLIIQEGQMQVNQGEDGTHRTDVGPFQIEE